MRLVGFSSIRDRAIVIVRAVKTYGSTSGRRAIQALSLAVLTGCAVGPDFKQPDAPDVKGFLSQRDGPPGDALVPGADVAARWWDVLGSPGLNRLIEDGIANNPDLAAAEAAVRVAQANALSLRGTLLPVVTDCPAPAPTKVSLDPVVSATPV